MKIARCLLIGFILLWIAQDIPSFIFQNLIYTNGRPSCVTSNSIYVLYHTYGMAIVLTIVPISLISFFAFRIYRHLHSLTRGNQQFLSASARQMTLMALYQIAVVLLFQFPYGVATAYFTTTTNVAKSQERQLQDKLTQAFFSVYVYGLYSVRNQFHPDRRNILYFFQTSFYCYYIASKRFRRQVFNIIKGFGIERRPNRILPMRIKFRSVHTQQ
jgi:hypothetical protein